MDFQRTSNGIEKLQGKNNIVLDDFLSIIIDLMRDIKADIFKLETDDAEFANELYEKAYSVLCGYADADAHGEPQISDDRDENVWGCTVIYSVEVDAGDKYDEVKKVGGETHYYKLVSCCITRTLIDGEYSFTIDLPLV